MSGKNLFVHLAVAVCVAAVVVAQDAPARLDAVVINGTMPGMCPPQSDLDAGVTAARASVQQAFQAAPCGGLGWTRIYSLDMSDTSQMCPNGWTLSNVPARSCTSVNENSCTGVTFPVPGSGTYSRVCGRIFGYGVNTPDAFHGSARGINDAYLDGISLTYGSPRRHIWTFAIGHGAQFGAVNVRCPCANPDRDAAPLPPEFVGDNYFCDSLDNTAPQWNGEGCSNTCCMFNNPPYFTSNLSGPTSDAIEARMCHNQNNADEAIHVSFMEIFVQ